MAKRLSKREEELEYLQKCLKHEEAKQCTIQPAMVRDFMRKLRRGTYDTLKYQKMLVHIFVDKIFLYDDHFTLLLNNNKKRANTSKAEVETIEEYFAGVSSDTEECSVPTRDRVSKKILCFFVKKLSGVRTQKGMSLRWRLIVRARLSRA